MIPIFLAGTTGLIAIAFLEEVNSEKNVSLILNLLIRKVLDLRSVSIEGRRTGENKYCPGSICLQLM